MKRLLCLATLLAFTSPLALGQSTTKSATATNRAEDEAAIRQIVANWDKGWKDFDAQIATRDYADDADWINAFGVAEKGRAEIQKYLAEIYTRAGIRSRKSLPSTVSIRFIQPDVAVVSAFMETVGQKAENGNAYATRKTHSLRVMIKQAGKWLIVSHQIMDEKERL